MACSLSIASALSVTQAQTLQPTPERATDHAPPDASSTLARSQYLRSLSRRHSVTILCRQFTVKWRVTCFDVVRTTLCTNRTTDRMLARRSDLRGEPGGRAIGQYGTQQPRGFCASRDITEIPQPACSRFQYLSGLTQHLFERCAPAARISLLCRRPGDNRSPLSELQIARLFWGR